MTLRETILAQVSRGAACDDCLALQARVSPRQSVNATARALADLRMLTREVAACPACGKEKTVNALRDPAAPPRRAPAFAVPVHADGLSEDELKRFLSRWLEGAGWAVERRMGREHGTDLDARRGGARWVIEAKGAGSSQPMRVNYFLAVLGETLQRMSDPDARYSVALPDLPQYRRLWARLPALAKERTGVTALFVREDGAVEEAA